MESKKVARVNDHVIYEHQLDSMVSAYKRQYNKKEVNLEEKRHILEGMVKNYVLLDEARKQEIKVQKKAIQEQVDRIKNRFKSEADFMAELKRNQLDIYAFREDIKNSLCIQMVTNQAIQDNVKLTVDMFEEYYKNHEDNMIVPEMVRAKHILVSTQKEKTREEARKSARELRKKIEQGEAFEDVARQHSDCPSGAKGGDLGLFSRGQMTGEFEKAAFLANPDEVSDLVETEFGFHIIKVEEKKAEKKLSYKEAQPYIEKIIHQQEGQKIINKLVAELKVKAAIEYF